MKRFLTFLIAVSAVIRLSAEEKLQVKGKVTDPDGEPVVGAIVLLQGTNFATSTN